MLAVDPVLLQAAELARVLARAHQGAATQLIGEGWPHARNFGAQKDSHPPMRGWLAVPVVGFDGQNYGFIQASDRLEGEFTEQDEANLVRLAALTSAALDGLAQLYLPEYQDKVAT
jgi:GAF domain-containing protein